MSECKGQMCLSDFTRGNERTVELIDRDRARFFIEKIHYSRKYPMNTVYNFGLYRNNKLIGVCCYGIPASPSLCKGLAGKENKDRVLELNRLALAPEWGGKTKLVI